MKEKISVRLFYEASCGCCGGGCENAAIIGFESYALKLAEKYGLKNVRFEAYNALDTKRFPFLEKVKAPAVAIGEKVMSSGKLPKFEDLDKEVGKQLKVA